MTTKHVGVAEDNLVMGLTQSDWTDLEKKHLTEPDSAHLETRRPGRRCPCGVWAGGSVSTDRVGLGRGGRAKGPFQLGVGLPHSRATSPHMLTVETGSGSTFLLERSSWSLEEKPQGE